MHKQSKKGVNFKFVDLSSEGESDHQSEKENIDCRSHTSYKTYSNNSYLKPTTHEGQIAPRQNSIINYAKSTTPLKDMQFSTLSLEEGSVLQFDHPPKFNNSDRNHLTKENEDLKCLNRQLQAEIKSMISTTTLLQQKICGYQERIQWYQRQVSDLQAKIATIEMRHSKTVKEFQNKLLNYELPGNKNLVQETRKIFCEIKDKINGLTIKYLEVFSKERMNANVEQLITNLFNQLHQISFNEDQSSTDRTYDFSSNKFKTSTRGKTYRSQRINQLVGKDSQTSTPISQDYRLLEKSIQKLKNMQKQIETCGGSYLKKKAEEESSLHCKSLALDQSSICDLGRSKSRRKRIFQ